MREPESAKKATLVVMYDFNKVFVLGNYVFLTFKMLLSQFFRIENLTLKSLTL